MKLEIYLTLDGQCEEAMKYYKEIFGGEIVGLQPRRYRIFAAQD